MFADQRINALALVRKQLAVLVDGTGIKAERIVPAKEIVALLEQITGRDTV